jgi:cytochrome b561
MHELPLSPQKLKLYSVAQMGRRHRIFLSSAAPRLAPGASPAGTASGMPAWQRRPPQATHCAALPADVRRAALRLADEFGQGLPDRLVRCLPLPDLLARTSELGDLLQTVHMLLNFGMAGLVTGHVGAALKHHFIDRDEVLIRMLPFLCQRTDSGDSR